MPKCPFCSDRLLRHFRDKKTYWFCASCRHEVPLLESIRHSAKKPLLKI